MKISDITVGERARTSAGWLDDLQRSIEQVGVLQPVGVTPENELIFGHRRVMACRALGMEDIPARILDINPDDPAHVLRMEQAENNIRKDFTPSERVEIARRIEEALAGRQGGDRARGKCLPLESEGKSTDIAAKSVGWSGDRASVATFQPRQMFAYLDRRQIHRHSRQIRRLVRCGRIHPMIC